MRYVALFFAAFSFLGFVSKISSQNVFPEYGSSGYNATVISAPEPSYPYHARIRGLVGSGIVLLEVDKRTGLVISARMQPSTGHKILDDAALKAFKKWCFNPRMLKR